MKTIKPGTREVRAVTLDRAMINQESRIAELAFSSEIPVERWFGKEILSHEPGAIRMGRLASGSCPLLMDHENSVECQIGVVESASIGTDRVGRASVRFGKGEDDEVIYQKVLDGIVSNVSVGYIVHAARLIATDKNGVDTFLVTDWEPLEISLVAVPADTTVGVGRSIDDFIINDMESRKMDQPKIETVDIQKQVDEQVKRALDATNKRNADIMTIGENHADYDGVELAARAIAEGKTVQEFQALMLEQIRKGQPSKPATSAPYITVTENADADLKRGFKHFGDFANSVMQSHRNVDERLTRSTTTYSNEAAGPDGGYAVPPEFGQRIVDMAMEEQSLLALSEQTPISGNSMRFPKDEGTPWGTSGITATWENEAAVKTPTKENELRESELRLKKLMVLVPATEELLADSTAMTTHLTRKMGVRLDWKVQDAVVNGIGAGQPLGITKSSAYVSQAKETSQTTDTINAQNVAKMLGRVIGGAGARFAWLINPDAYNQVITMTLNNNPVWTPPSAGFKDAPSGFLLGKPIIQTDTCQTLGDKFDIILANMAGYTTITKSGGAELATSMHLYFDQQLMAFRLTFRMDGQPLLSGPVTPPNSAITRAHFVTLDART